MNQLRYRHYFFPRQQLSLDQRNRLAEVSPDELMTQYRFLLRPRKPWRSDPQTPSTARILTRTSLALSTGLGRSSIRSWRGSVYTRTFI